MRVGDAAGGLALVGVAVLVGLALADDDPRDTITTGASSFEFDAGAATTSTTVLAAAPTVQTTMPIATTTASTTTLVPRDQRGGIALRVLNGGAPAGAAAAMSAALRGVGFAPAEPLDAPTNVEASQVMFAPGRQLEAATVNAVVKALPENVAAASADDPNWAEFGDALAVLVVLGPPAT